MLIVSRPQVPNASPTAASASSDMYGGATADACAQLNQRLEPFRMPGKPFAVRPFMMYGLRHPS